MKQPSVATIVVLWLVAGAVLTWVFCRVVHRDRELDETAEADMWDRTIADYHPSVRTPK